jgi:hypothetical protein
MKKICIGFCFVVFTLIVIKLGALQAVLGFQDGPPVDLLTQGLDRNGDARLSASEIKDAPSVLGSLDKNRDGRLTVEEIFPPMNRPQDRRRSDPGMGPGGPDRMPQRDLIGEFDVDKNNRLEGEELRLALESVANQPPQRRGPKRRPRGRETVKPSQPGREISKDSVVNSPNLPLYDATILRTVFIDIESDQWEKDMASLKDYGVDIEATVTVDQQAYEKVGLRFRGNSSFFSLGDGQKRSLNLTFDWADKKQNLYGYRTLNLLNSHSDASFLRLVLYSRIAQDYIPVPKANYVHVVINGESWGVYINEQQFNSDFTKEHFDSKGGRRWKAPPGREGASFTYKGDQSDAYRAYELKTKDTPESWDALINATKMMEQTDSEDFESTLDKAICIDRILWFLAIDNVMLDMDGYYQRGADYSIYQEPKFKRFHILPYDNNETFRAQGSHGPGFGGGPPGAGPGMGGLFGGLFGGGPPQGGPPQGGPPQGGPPPQNGVGGESLKPFDLEIFAGIEQPLAPFINRLLENPELKARYVAHVRTIYQDWCDWDTVAPLIASYRNLISDEIKMDTRKLTSWEAFEAGVGMSSSQGRDQSPGLQAFFKGRKAYLDSVPELSQNYPEIRSVKAVTASPGEAGIPVNVSVTLSKNSVEPKQVLLYYSTDRLAKFKMLEMKSFGDNAFAITTEPMPVGKTLYYYCEARTDDEYLTTAFYPQYAEGKPGQLLLIPQRKKNPSLVINEIMAANASYKMNSKGEYADWIEIKNTSNGEVDLSGMYLTDDKEDLRKWAFPEGTTVAEGDYLIVWADGTKNSSGKFASFKLSKSGETIWLIGTNGNGNPIVDALKFGKQIDGRSYGQTKNGEFEIQTPTLGSDNEK